MRTLTLYQNVTNATSTKYFTLPTGIIRKICIAGCCANNGGAPGTQYGQVLVSTQPDSTQVAQVDGNALLAAAIGVIHSSTAAGYSSVTIAREVEINLPIKTGDIIYVHWTGQTNIATYAYVTLLIEDV